jgi:hypothetical protein
MTLQTRLQKVTQNLSPLQRISLMLQAQKEGRDSDPELGHVTDPQQSKAFNRYVALLYVINRELGAVCHLVSGWAEFLDHSANQVRLLEQGAGILEEDHRIERVKRPRDWRKHNMEIPEFMRSLAQDLRADLIAALAERWSELAALEVVWEELAAEFGGEDPVGPELRELATETKDRLLSVSREFGAQRRLAGASEASLAEVRRTVDEAFAKLEPLL